MGEAINRTIALQRTATLATGILNAFYWYQIIVHVIGNALCWHVVLLPSVGFAKRLIIYFLFTKHSLNGYYNLYKR